MNFKPTLWKSIVSVILGLFGGYIALMKGIEVVFAFIAITLVIYIIWSLIQKKK